MQYALMTQEELKYNINEPIIVWGLSETTKRLYNEFDIQYIVDNNVSLHNTYYKKAKIISSNSLLSLKNKILLWGNHVSSHLLELDAMESTHIVYVNSSYTKESILKITKEYFQSIEDDKTQKKLFKNIVKMIEIEPHSFCNRTCWFCPNNYIDRRSETFFLDKSIIEKLCKDLQSIDYDKTISFTRYSEPFGNEVFYETLKFIHDRLPNATLHANTNADYLNDETLLKAYRAGLKSLNIQLYLSKNEPFNQNAIDKIAKKILNKTSTLKATLSSVRKDWIEYSCTYEDMNIRMYGRDFSANGSNRGDILIKESANRTSPCLLPITDIYIDYNGYVVPCCNMRSDDSTQQRNIIAKIQDHNSIFELYFCSNFLKWRKKLFSYNTKNFSPCSKCEFSVLPNNEFYATHLSHIMHPK